jgi:hypothetical protein
MLAMMRGMWTARAVQTAGELGVADLLDDGPRPVDELAEATGTHAPSLYRLMRALSAFGVFEELEGRRFAQTERSAFLSSSHPMSMRGAAKMFGSEWAWRSWAAFPHSVRTGEPAFDEVYGTSLWDYFDNVDPEAGAVFDAAMTSVSGRLHGPIVAAYDFSVFRTLADVGGGHGHLLVAILEANPGLRGLLFDRPSAVADLHERLRGPELADRVDVVGGSFFDAVPKGADGYLIKGVLHDWDDEPAIAILQRLREAVPADGRLLVVEHVMSRGPAFHQAVLLDLEMLKNHAGRERTEEEFRDLLARGGFTLQRVFPAGPVSVIEATPA